MNNLNLFFDKLIEYRAQLIKIHKLYEFLYPIIIAKDNIAYEYMFSLKYNKYILENKFETNINLNNVVACANFSKNKLLPKCIIGKNLISRMDIDLLCVMTFHEFVHCYQIYNGELKIKKTLDIYDELDPSWELNYKFPYDSLNIINKLKDKGVNYFVFTGGETLLRDDLVEILAATRSKNVTYELITNGSLLKSKFNDIIDLVDFVSMSLDSFDLNINAKNRSDTNFYDILSLLDMFKFDYKNKLIIKSVITKNNFREIFEFHKQIRDIYGFHTSMAPFMPNNPSDVEKVRDLNCFDESLLAQLNSINNNPPKYLPMYINRYGACRNIIAINPSGDIFPCQSLLRNEFKITNILNKNWYEDIKNSVVSKKFYNLTVDKIEKCKDCSYRYLCSGGCPAVAYKACGDIKKPLEFFCKGYMKDSQYYLKSICK